MLRAKKEVLDRLRIRRHQVSIRQVLRRWKRGEIDGLDVVGCGFEVGVEVCLGRSGVGAAAEAEGLVFVC